jgi:hypothetical protein
MGQFPEIGVLPVWAQWLAQDGDGTWWVYEVEPLQYHRGWYENEIGRRLRVAAGGPNEDWAGTLRRIR